MSDVYRITEHGVEWEPIEIENGKVVRCERIAELEAQNRIFRNTESVDDSVWDALLEQVRVLQAKLDVFDEMDEMLRICLKANVSMAEELDRVRGCEIMYWSIDGMFACRPGIGPDDPESYMRVSDVLSTLGDEDE